VIFGVFVICDFLCLCHTFFTDFTIIFIIRVCGGWLLLSSCLYSACMRCTSAAFYAKLTFAVADVESDVEGEVCNARDGGRRKQHFDRHSSRYS